MRNIRFDIKDLKVKGCKGKHDSYTMIEGVMEANLVDFGVEKEVLARLEFKKDNYSKGYTVKMNKLSKSEFGNLVIYLNMFMVIIGNVKLGDGEELEFNHENFSWIGYTHNEAFVELYEAYKIGKEAKNLGIW